MNPYTLDEEREQILSQIYQLTILKDLAISPAWKVLRNHFTNVLQAVVTQLLTTQDMNEVVRLQERHRAFSSLLESVESSFNELDQQRFRLDSLEAEKHERDQTGLD